MHDLITWTSLAILIAGFFSGILAGVLGVGGAVLTTPFIRFLGASPIASVGSTVPAILPGAFSGAIRYHRARLVDWRVACTCGLSGMAFAALGGWVADIVDARWLMVVTALLVMWSGIHLFRAGHGDAPIVDDEPVALDGQPGLDDLGFVDAAAQGPRGSTRRASFPLLVGMGMVAGFLAGLLGIGGGIVLTPGLTLVVRLPVKRAIATSLAAVAMMSTTALATHIALGHVSWRFALPLAAGVVPGVQVGARITIAASDRATRVACGALLMVLSVIYLVSELAHIF